MEVGRLKNRSIARLEVRHGKRITQDTMAEYLCGHPELAEHVARIWFALLGRLFEEPGRTKAGAILKQAPRSILDAAHLSVHTVIPIGVPALPALAFGVCKAGGRTQ